MVNGAKMQASSTNENGYVSLLTDLKIKIKIEVIVFIYVYSTREMLSRSILAYLTNQCTQNWRLKILPAMWHSRGNLAIRMNNLPSEVISKDGFLWPKLPSDR